jgi:riboflavin synthase
VAVYSGIVSNQGIVVKRREGNRQIHFGFRFLRKEKPIKLGESIAVDGVCLTVAGLRPRGFEADVVRETLDATTLGSLKLGGRVNLERSLKTGDEIGGHFVTGHIDGRGRIVHIEKRKKNWLITFEASRSIMKVLAQKGSIAVDGISLTIQGLSKKFFKITIIPHTLKETTLGRKGVGDWVNLEIDLITRYLKVLTDTVRPPKTSALLVKLLKSHGF